MIDKVSSLTRKLERKFDTVTPFSLRSYATVYKILTRFLTVDTSPKNN